MNVDEGVVGSVDGGATGSVADDPDSFAVGGSSGEITKAGTGDGHVGGAKALLRGAVPGSIASEAIAPGSMVSTSFDIQEILRSIQTRS